MVQVTRLLTPHPELAAEINSLIQLYSVSLESAPSDPVSYVFPLLLLVHIGRVFQQLQGVVSCLSPSADSAVPWPGGGVT